MDTCLLYSRSPPTQLPAWFSITAPTQPAALFFDCSGSLFAVVGSNGIGEAFAPSSSLIRVNVNLGTATVVCPFSPEQRRVGAMIDSTRVAHFYGSNPPTMEVMSLSGQASSALCKSS